MPNLDFTSIGGTPAYNGNIEIHVKQIMEPQAASIPKRDAQGRMLFLNPEGQETVKSSRKVPGQPDIDFSVIFVPEKDDDGITDRVLEFTGHVESTPHTEKGEQIVALAKRFPFGSLPLAIRQKQREVFEMIRAEYATGLTAATGKAVRERK